MPMLASIIWSRDLNFEIHISRVWELANKIVKFKVSRDKIGISRTNKYSCFMI